MVDEILARREAFVAVIRAAEAARDEAAAANNRRFNEVAGTPIEMVEKIDTEELGPLLERHHYQLTSRHSKTIVRENGVIKEVVRAVEMDTPANTKPVINYLLCRRGGRKYLKVTYSLDLYALRYAPQELQSELRYRFGFWWGKHRTFSVKSLSDKVAKQVSRRRYNERS